MRVNIPMMLVQVAIDTGMNMSTVSGSGAMKNVDWAQILSLVQSGVMGNLVEIEDGKDIVRIFVE